jgi:hypothetical protein
MLRIFVAEARGQFGNPEEGDLPLEAVTRGLVKTELTEMNKCVL